MLKTLSISGMNSTREMKSAVYIRMPRCGSKSLVTRCSLANIPFYGGRCMGFWVGKNTSDHLYECVSNHIDPDTYAKSFIFSSIRNPYSRALSMYLHHSWRSAKTFKDFCHSIKHNEYPDDCAKFHSSTLTEHLVSGDNLKVDFIVRLENIQEDFNTVCDKIGIPHQQLPHVNKTKHKHYTEYYDDETKEIIAEKYIKDIEYFGYEYGE